MPKPWLPCPLQAPRVWALEALHLLADKQEGEARGAHQTSRGGAPIEDFPETTRCLMIFDDTEAYGDKRCLMVAHHKVHTAEPTVPRYLRWSEFLIVFENATTQIGSCTSGPTPRH
jgi:hypothetical protein